MHKIWQAFFTGLFTFSACSLCAVQELVTFKLGSGYRQDHLHVGIQADPCFPVQFASRLVWSDIQAYMVEGSVTMLTCDRVYLRASIDYGAIRHGNFKHEVTLNFNSNPVTISDVDGDADQGHLFDYNLGIGYQFAFVGGRVTLTPVGGYSYHEQNFFMDNLVQESFFFGPRGPRANLRKSYRTRWYSPWAGIDFTFGMTRCLSLQGGFEYHWASFRAKGEWNLNRDTEHRQKAWSVGQVYQMALNYEFNFADRDWTIGIEGRYMNWETRHGKNEEFGDDRIFDVEELIKSELRHTHWHSWSAMAILQYYY